MPTFNITDQETGMKIRVQGENAPSEADMPQLFAAARQNASEQLATGAYQRTPEFKKVSKADQRKRIQSLSAAALGVSNDDVDTHSGASFKERTVLSGLPDDQSRLEYMEKKYGADNVEMLDVGGTPKMFYRDPKSNKLTMVDEQGASLADFTADLAGEVAPIAGAITGAVKGATIGTAVAPGLGTAAGAVLGAAAGGFGAGVTQDVAAEALTGQDIDLGKIVERRGKEAFLGAGLDVALLGTGKFVAKPLLSKVTGDAVSRTMTKAEELLPEGSLTPRMLQGEAATTRELGLEPNVGGRVGDARSAINQKVTDLVSQADPVAYDRYVQGIQAERAALEEATSDVADRALQDRVAEYYNEALNRFGDSQGRVIANIGDDLIERSTDPAFRAARENKNRLYGEFNAIDEQVGGVFTPDAVLKRFNRVLESNRTKNVSDVKAIMREIEQADRAYSISEMDDLIGRVTDKISASGAVKDKTAQQVASELSDSLTSAVRNKAKQFPELNQAWNDANRYYKDTYLRFNRGAVGGSVRDVSGAPSLTGQGFMNQVLSDPAEVRNLLQAAKEGGQSPSVVKGRLKEAWLEKKGIRKGEMVRNLTLSPADRSMVKELWGSKGLKRMESISKGLQATPDDLDAYLGALTDKRASEVRKELLKRDNDIKRLDRIMKNKFIKEMSEGNIPAGQPKAITEAYLRMPKSNRDELFRNMDKDALEDLKGTVGAYTMMSDIDASPFVGSMGENLFNGQAALKRLDQQAERLKDLLGKEEYEQLRTLARAQSQLKPLTKDQAQTKLRGLVGPGGFSMYVVGDIIQAAKDKFVALAYRTKALDGLTSGWSKLDPKTLNKALQKMLYGAQAKRALIDMDDPELEQQVELLKQAVPEQ